MMNCFKCVTGTYVANTSDTACNLSNSLPSLSITSPHNILHLTDLDADLNMPLDNNFCFYSTHDINECLLNGQSFSLINCNIRSLSAHFDKRSNLLSELYFPFSLIGLIEIKQKIDKPPILNTDLGCVYTNADSYRYGFTISKPHRNRCGLEVFKRNRFRTVDVIPKSSQTKGF